jgi:hypothetical protein
MTARGPSSRCRAVPARGSHATRESGRDHPADPGPRPSQDDRRRRGEPSPADERVRMSGPPPPRAFARPPAPAGPCMPRLADRRGAGQLYRPGCARRPRDHHARPRRPPRGAPQRLPPPRGEGRGRGAGAGEVLRLPLPRMDLRHRRVPPARPPRARLRRARARRARSGRDPRGRAPWVRLDLLRSGVTARRGRAPGRARARARRARPRSPRRARGARARDRHELEARDRRLPRGLPHSIDPPGHVLPRGVRQPGAPRPLRAAQPRHLSLAEGLRTGGAGRRDVGAPPRGEPHLSFVSEHDRRGRALPRRDLRRAADRRRALADPDDGAGGPRAARPPAGQGPRGHRAAQGGARRGLRDRRVDPGGLRRGRQPVLPLRPVRGRAGHFHRSLDAALDAAQGDAEAEGGAAPRDQISSRRSGACSP